MTSFFDKIHTLVSAQLNDLLGRHPRSPLARIRLNPEQVEKDPQGAARGVRRRLQEAMDYEDELAQRVEAIMQGAMALDQRVDAALRSGDDIGARHIQEQLNMKRRQLTIAESELRDHRRMTQHLLREMSTLDDALDQQRRDPAGQGGRRIPVAGGGSRAGSGNAGIRGAVSGKLDEARSGLESLLSSSPVPKPQDIARKYDRFDVIDEAPDPRQSKPRKPDKGDMDDRLSRLRKPGDRG